MRIVHVTNSIDLDRGGVPCAVRGIASAQQDRGHPVSLMAMADSHCKQDRPADRSTEIRIHTFRRNVPKAAFWSFDLHAALMDPAVGGNADILHQHGIWSAWSYSVGRWSERWKRPSLLAIHGGLSEATLKRNPWKKKIFELLCGNKRFRTASCLHALCEQEVINIRNHGVKAPIAVVPNGVKLEDYDNLPDAVHFARRFPKCKDRPVVLYLGRIHPLKGVSQLLDAWKRLENHRRNDWLLVVAGPNDFGFEDEMKQKAEAMNLNDNVLFTGPLYGQAKLEALAAASLFVLPSLSEGFPNSLLEALACRLPLVQTHQCNFNEVETEGAGWIGRPDADSLAECLDAAMSLSDTERQATGQRGYDLVQRKYTWDRVARELELVYTWMLGGSDVPSCVRVVSHQPHKAATGGRAA